MLNADHCVSETSRPKTQRFELEAEPPPTSYLARLDKKTSTTSLRCHDKRFRVSYFPAAPMLSHPDDLTAALSQRRSSFGDISSHSTTISEIIDLYLDPSISRVPSVESIDHPLPSNIEHQDSQVSLSIKMRHRATEYRDTIASFIEHQFDSSETSSQYSQYTPEPSAVSDLPETQDGTTPSRPPSLTPPETPAPLQRKRRNPTPTPPCHNLDIPYKQNKAKHAVPEPSKPNLTPIKSIHCVPTQDEYSPPPHPNPSPSEDLSEYPHFDNPQLWLQDVLQPATPRLFEPCTSSDRACTCSFCNLTRRVHGLDSSFAVRSPTSDGDGLGSANSTPRTGTGSFEVPRPVTLVSGRARADGVRRDSRQEGRVKSWARGVVRSLTMGSEERRRARLKDSIVMVGCGGFEEGRRNRSI